MIASVASTAFGSPPLTGASRNSTPFAAHAAATFCDTSGLIHVRPVRQHGDDRFTARGHIAARYSALGAVGHRRVQQSRHDVVRHHLVAALHEVARHRLAHDAQTDKSDFH
jgi:hypothetical protein